MSAHIKKWIFGCTQIRYYTKCLVKEDQLFLFYKILRLIVFSASLLSARYRATSEQMSSMNSNERRNSLQFEKNILTLTLMINMEQKPLHIFYK